MSEVTGTIEQHTYDWNIAEQAFTCDNCGRMNMRSDVRPARHSSSTNGLRGREDWFPRHDETRAFPDVPEHIAEAASEATLCLSIGAYRAAGSLARAVIEATAKHQEISGRNLEARIDGLAEAGFVRVHTRDQAHEVRHFGNDMAHGDFVDPVTKEEAEEVIELMAEVLDEVYQSPARLARVRAGRVAKRQPQE